MAREYMNKTEAKFNEILNWKRPYQLQKNLP